MKPTALASKAAEFLFDQVGMSHRFSVQLDEGDIDLGTWSKASGLSVNWAPITYRPGEQNDQYVLPGSPRYNNVRLARAACTDTAKVQSWLAKVSRRPKPISGSIQLIDYMFMPIMTWSMRGLVPVGWNVSEFDSMSRNAAIESIEFAHSGFLDDSAVLL